jgi:hypothetical protein
MGSKVDAVGGWGGADLMAYLSDGSLVFPRSSLSGGALFRSRLHLAEQVHLAAVACLVEQLVQNRRSGAAPHGP